MQPCRNLQIFADGEGPLKWAGVIFLLWLINLFCVCGLVGPEEERKGRGQELIVTHVHVSKFQELIPIMISHFGSMHVHLNHTTFILSFAFGF